MRRTEVKNVIKGAFRAVEVTYNADKDEWHPHMHVLLFVPSRYFTTSQYIKHERWKELWRESTRDPSITEVRIETVKNKGDTHATLAAVVSEMAKYPLKPPQSPKSRKNHTFIRKTEEESKRAVEQLLAGLKGRHLVQFSGLFKELFKELGIGKKQSPDVAEAEEDEEKSKSRLCSVCGKPLVEHLYRWNQGLENYVG